jgi:hypothetical protein
MDKCKILNFNKVDIAQLQKESNMLFDTPGVVHELFRHQIGLTFMDDNCQNKFQDGVGSLDWDYSKWNHETEKNPPRSDRNATEKDFSKIVPEIKNMYLGEIIKNLQTTYNVGRARLMRLTSKTCLTWHYDSTPRIHLPIITNDKCFMVWENYTKHLEEGILYQVNTKIPHTAMNASFEERIHIVATVDG